MLHDIGYSPFKKYVVRTPVLSYTEVSNLTIKDIKKLCENPIVSEAIYIASPELHKEMTKLIQGIKFKNEDKLIYSLLKYLLRMGNRCTPFGLFCGISVGNIKEKYSVEVDKIENHKRTTRLDMNFLCELSQNIEAISSIRKSLNFFPNTSLFKIGESLRYIESRYENLVRNHFMMSIDYSEYIEKILQKAKFGATINELATTIIEPEISLDDAICFINELVENQILISSISPSVSGSDYFEIIKKNINSNNPLSKGLDKIQDVLSNINNSKIGEGFKYYNQLYDLLDLYGLKYNKKYLLQTDLITSFKKNIISDSIFKDVNEGLIALNKLTLFFESAFLTKFKTDFFNRYEDEEIPLALVLDVESGIGFAGNEQKSYDVLPLIDDLNIEMKASDISQNIKETKWTQGDEILHKKLIEALKNGDSEITLTEKDLENLKENWNNLPNTFSVFLNIVDNISPKTYMSIAGGATASSILGRYCHSDSKMNDYVNEIIQKEEVSNQHIYAEILHLPENRVGNILHRPHLRKYEIPYLSKSNLPTEQQILIDDILVSIRNNRIVLRSKTHDKEIIPRLATAHAYSSESLPVYHFLCELQTQDLRGSLSFSWANSYSFFKYFPRVNYKNIILSPAQWIINASDIKELILNNDIISWRKKRNMPPKLMLLEDENELFIDTEHELSVKMFIKTIKNKKQIMINEYLFNPNNSLVSNGKNPFANEIILAFYKN